MAESIAFVDLGVEFFKCHFSNTCIYKLYEEWLKGDNQMSTFEKVDRSRVCIEAMAGGCARNYGVHWK